MRHFRGPLKYLTFSKLVLSQKRFHLQLDFGEVCQKYKKIFETEVYVKKDKNKKENLLKRIIKNLKKLFK